MVDVTGQTRIEKVILPSYLQGKKPNTIPNKKVKITSFLTIFISSESSLFHKIFTLEQYWKVFLSVYWNMAVAIYVCLMAILEVPFLSAARTNSFCIRPLQESSVSKRAELPPFSLRHLNGLIRLKTQTSINFQTVFKVPLQFLVKLGCLFVILQGEWTEVNCRLSNSVPDWRATNFLFVSYFVCKDRRSCRRKGQHIFSGNKTGSYRLPSHPTQSDIWSAKGRLHLCNHCNHEECWCELLKVSLNS